MTATVDAIVMDVDGVLTDGGFWWSTSGEESKRFSFRDVMGISVGRRAGIAFGLVSGEDSPLVTRYAQKLGIREVHLDCKDKAAALSTISARISIPLSRICFIGDDINDLPAMAIAGFSAAPADAYPAVLEAAAWKLRCSGGHGAVRELVDFVMAHYRKPA